jgi:hypothetical protein
MKLDLEAWATYAGDLRVAQRAALLQLATVAWTQNPPCTLPADHEFLAECSGAGAAWPKLCPAIIARFDPADDRYEWPWLRQLFEEQMASYQTRQRASGDQPRRAGRFGHRTTDRIAVRDANRFTDGNGPAPPSDTRSAMPTAAPSAVRSASPSAMRTDEPSQILEVKVIEKESLQTLSLSQEKGESARARARVDEAPRAPAAPEPDPDAPTSAHADALSAAQVAARYGAAVAANAAGANPGDERSELHAAYYRELKKHGERWLAAHPDAAAELEATLRRELSIPVGQASRWLADTLLESVRQQLHWPDADTWVERELRKQTGVVAFLTPDESA